MLKRRRDRQNGQGRRWIGDLHRPYHVVFRNGDELSGKESRVAIRRHKPAWFFSRFELLWSAVYLLWRAQIENYAWWMVEAAILLVTIIYGHYVLRDAARGIIGGGFFVCLRSPGLAFLSGFRLSILIPVLILSVSGLIVGIAWLLRTMGFVHF